ncbi:MAG: sulfite exporter TauE/SafE family protein [Janthinobacterium lividum]
MTPGLTHVVLLFLAGVGSGLTGYGAGLASVVSYPALLAVGLSPLTANATNTAALTGIALGGVGSARAELTGVRARIIRFGVAGLVGGAIGAGLLVVLPESIFAAVVPWLVVLGAAVLLLRPWLQRLHRGRWSEHDPLVVATVGLVAVYGGYFGAAAGTLVVAVLGLVLTDPLVRITALRAVVLGLANLVATVIFVARDLVAWTAMLPLAVGMFLGGALAPRILRRLPDLLVRILVAVAALGLAAFLLTRSHHP